MKLINKFTLWYLSITMACTIVGSAITYYSIKNRIDQAGVDRLKTVNKIASEKLQAGTFGDSIVQGRKVEIREVATIPADPFYVNSTTVKDPVSNKPEYNLTVTSYYTVAGKNYSFTCYAYGNKAEQILSGLEVSILWKWLLILSLIAVSARLVSRYILSPLNHTMKSLETFNLKQKEKLVLSNTNTKEFKQLNKFVQSMTDKAVEDYASLKEFTENASHELQTPVAVMRGKLDLLGESSLTDEQAILISDVQNSLDKLSKINSSLILLTRLENHEYATNEPLQFCKLINATLAGYTELLEMKSITLTKSVAKKVFVPLHAALGDLLLTNLISNAIRHNIPEGRIDVTLSHSSLVIKNTGNAPSVPTEELFQRFKKGNQCSKSIGIGLAIVKQICDIHQFKIEYVFNEGYHILEIQFKSIEPPATTIKADVDQVVEPVFAVYSAG